MLTACETRWHGVAAEIEAGDHLPICPAALTARLRKKYL